MRVKNYVFGILVFALESSFNWFTFQTNIKLTADIANYL